MGFYARHVLPRLLEAVMHDPRLGRHRAPVVGSAQGRILEIGFGTGANLPYYPSGVRRIDADHQHFANHLRLGHPCS